VKLGLLTPVVSLNPRAHNAWEIDADVDDLVEIARAADRLGYHHLTCSEHVAVPTEVEARRGTRYWDPVATLSFLAARTERIRLASHVVVLPYHHPLEVVKQYGTLDRLSAGRLVLGVGVGSLREEFDLLGVPFDERGSRTDDSLRAIRAAWGVHVPSYHGRHFDFDGFEVDPLPVQERVPVWVGGRTRRSLRRAVELGDGWAPFGLSPDEVAAMLADARRSDAWSERTTPLDVVLWPEPPPDPSGDPDGVHATLQPWVDAGATVLNVRLASRSAHHHLEQMEALAATVAEA
jgi:probable F420-dependent oxidoreductase